MKARDRVLAALQREEVDRPPKCGRFTPPVLRAFNEKIQAGIPQDHLKNTGIPTGFITEDLPDVITPDEYFKWDIRHVNFRAGKEVKDFTGFYQAIPEGIIINDWGVGLVPEENSHYFRRLFPLASREADPAILQDYPFPNFMKEERHQHLNGQVRKIQDQGYAVAGFLQETIFEVAWAIRGFENIFIDFMMNPDFASLLLDKITDIRCQMAKRYASAGVDIIRLGDDVGTQKGLMMSPEMWRKWLKPRLARVIESIRSVKPDVFVFYHTDGDVYPLIEEFIEIGIDVLNPIQPECMDPAKLKKEYGDRLSFWGTIGTQTTMPYGTPEQIEHIVKERIATVGKGGGLVIAPSHSLQPDVPWENIVALFNAVENR